MDTHEILDRALQLLEQEGWTQNTYADENGICPIRSIYRIVNEQYPWDKGGLRLYAQALGALQRELGVANIALWNDHPDRTFSEVREVFRRAAFVAGHQLQEA